MMSLYVASHYRNTPNDLILMSDAPAHHLFALLGPVEEGQVMFAQHHMLSLVAKPLQWHAAAVCLVFINNCATDSVVSATCSTPGL